VDGLEAGDPGHIGPFRLLGRLGEGGMGRVYLGASPGGRKVAIKVVHPQFARDPEFRRRFAREVDAARRVGGFHTALVVDAGPGADPPWMATAYIPGPSLAAAIAQRGPLDEAGTRELGAALAEGLAANIIVAGDGPRIIDFGIAKGAGATALTGSSAVIGTLHFMSPEQLQGQELTPRSDVFALGTILAYAATGRHPFEAPTDPAVITRILTGTPSLAPLPGELRDIIAGCLAKEPHSRPSPADLLTRLSPPAPGQARPGGPPGPGGQPHPRGCRRRTALIAAGATAAIALAVILGILLPRKPPRKHPSGRQPPGEQPFGRQAPGKHSQGHAHRHASRPRQWRRPIGRVRAGRHPRHRRQRRGRPRQHPPVGHHDQAANRHPHRPGQQRHLLGRIRARRHPRHRSRSGRPARWRRSWRCQGWPGSRPPAARALPPTAPSQDVTEPTGYSVT
jgi:hypothetical protein